MRARQPIAAAALATVLLAVAPSRARAQETEADPVGASVRRTYFFHRVRDLALFNRPPWRIFADLHYRSTHLAEATVNPRGYPDRGSLRTLQRWGAAALSGPVWAGWLLLVCATLLGWRRARPRMTRPRRAAWDACVALWAVLLAWGAWPAFTPSRWDLDRARRRGDAPALARTLHDADAERRAEAAHALAYLATQDEIDALRAGLADPDPRVRMWCATALGRLRDVRSFAALRDLLRDAPEPLVRSHAAGALAQTGLEEALPVLSTAAAREGEPLYVRIQIRDALDELRDRLRP